MKTLIIPTLILFAVPAFAAPVKDAKCSDITTLNEKVTPEYMAVVEGYDKAGKKMNEEVDLGGIVDTSKKVTEQCAKNKDAKVASVKKDVTKKADMAKTETKPSEETKLNPTKAKCEDFVELGEEVKPVAVFWVAGHDKAGTIKKGEVDEMFLERPIEALVAECKAQPQAPFYDKAKEWISRKI